MPEIDEPQPLNFNPVLQANTFTVVADIHHNQSDETTLPDDNSPFDIPLCFTTQYFHCGSRDLSRQFVQYSIMSSPITI